MKRVRLCVIGAGRAGLIHARNIAERIRPAELVALCDANADAVKQAGQELEVASLYTDYREALQQKDVDAVVIVTPTFLHREVACLAAARGKHVFLEKPMALTVGECREINKAVADARVKLQIGFMRRFDEGFIQAKQLLSSGKMGRVMIVKSTGRGPGGPGPWMYDLTKSNGVIAEVNSHDIDSVQWLVGRDVRRVYAEAANFKCPDAKEQFPDFYDNVIVSMRFVDDTLGTIDGTCPAGYAYDARVEVLCENGLLMIGTAVQQGFTHFTLDGQAIGRSVKSWRTLFKDAYLAEMEHFVQCILDDRPPSVNGTDGLKAVETVVAINQSIKTGMPVTLGREPI